MTFIIKIKSVLLFLLFLVFIAGLLAPFTFLKVEDPDQLNADSKDKTKVVKIKEKPLHSVKLPDFAAISDVKTKKKTFFNFLKPSITKENNKILAQRKQIQQWLTKVMLEEPLTTEEQKLLKSLVTKYKVNSNSSLMNQLNALVKRVDIIPAPLILVQAANESAWGTSRFARIGLNFFGIWCYRPTCGMVPKGRDSGAKHEVAAFQSVDASVNRYLFNINTNAAYEVFRSIRAQLRAQNQPLVPQILATGLLSYSERGADYIEEINEMMRHNKDYIF